jgi:hypothetical protein
MIYPIRITGRIYAIIPNSPKKNTFSAGPKAPLITPIMHKKITSSAQNDTSMKIRNLSSPLREPALLFFLLDDEAVLFLVVLRLAVVPFFDVFFLPDEEEDAVLLFAAIL